MVFYRKYRPQTIDELDSREVRETLIQVLKKNIPHAFLFTGPKGLGKTSTARIIAKVVNCTGKNRNGIEPCNTCEMCMSITSGTNMDVLEIDGASNRGIDEIRDLKEKIRLAPFSAAKKVYIIDEVHMLTTEAFNALLKTLEEPPSHALFILCTTEPQKIPATILSRCFHITFKPATEEELFRSFKRITPAEHIKITDEALSQIARLADGGFRDGVKLLEELVSLADGREISREFVEKQFNVSGTEKHVEMLLVHLAKRQEQEAITLINSLTREGQDIKYFLTVFLEELHSMLLSQVGVVKESKKKVEFTLPQIQELYYLATQAFHDMRDAVVMQMPLEFLVVSFLASPQVTEGTPETPVQKKDNDISVTSLRKQVGNIAKIKALYGEKDKKGIQARKEVLPDASLLDFSKDGDLTPEWLAAFWKGIIAEMRSHNHTIAGVLRGCMIKNYDRKSLTIQTSYAFHKEKLEEVKTKQALEDVCKTLTGKPVSVSIVLKD